jgi:hypothetical protein
MKDDLILFKIIHSRKLLNKLTMNFITVCFNFNTKVRRLYVVMMLLVLCYC